MIEYFAASAIILATPLALAALGEALAQRSGVINIGLEGSIIWGALGGALACIEAGPWVGLAVGALAGGLAALVFATFAVWLAADQIISGTAITLGSLGFTGALFQARFGETGIALELETAPRLALPLLSELPYVGEIVFSLPPTSWFALAAAAALSFFLFRTKWGLRLSAAGESPRAARAASVRIRRTRASASVFGGAMAGLSGAHLSLVHTGTFLEGMSQGKGFIAIAVVALGRWRPGGILLAALFFGAAEALGFTLQAANHDLPYPLFLALPYVLCLAGLSGWFGRAKAPAALGRTRR